MYNGKKLPKGVYYQRRNGNFLFYARIDGKPKYMGQGDKGLFLAKKAVSKVKTDHDLAQLYDIGRGDLAELVKQSKIDFVWHTEQGQGSGATVADMLAWYMGRPKVKKQQSHARKIDHVAHLNRHLGSYHVAQLQGDILEDYRENRLNEQASHGTIDLEMNTLRAAYNLAKKRGKLKANVIPGDFGSGESAAPRREVTKEEYKTLLEVVDADFKDFLVCAWEAGMRLTEIANLRVNRVHLNEIHIEDGKSVPTNYIELEAVDTKTGLRRIIPASKSLKEVLLRRIENLEPGDRVFTGNGVPYYRQWISSKMKTSCKVAGIVYGDKAGLDDMGQRVGIVFHCFRHTRTVRWLRKGFSDTFIRAATGHKTLAAYRTYADKAATPASIMRLVNGGKPVEAETARNRNTKSGKVAL